MLKGNQRAAANRRAKAPKAPKAPKAVKRSAADVAKGKAHYKVPSTGKTETLHRTSGAKKPDVSEPSHKVVSGQTFGQAFSAARKAQGSGGKFSYNGKEYSTRTKDDKDKPFGKVSGVNAIVPGNLQPKKKMPKNYVER